jgi:hypothetical protein
MGAKEEPCRPRMGFRWDLHGFTGKTLPEALKLPGGVIVEVLG